MKHGQLISTKKEDAKYVSLNEDIAALQKELADISKEVDVFEASLRSQLTAAIIEVQELSVLFKNQKQEKKLKRLEQKKKGKRHVAPANLTVQAQSSKAKKINEFDLKEKKRLYREAMLYVHPDNFSMKDDKIALATALTTRLVEIYKQEDLATLKAYHAHLFYHENLPMNTVSTVHKKKLTASPDAYLIKRKIQLEENLNNLKSRHTYHVLTTYEDPTTFIDELRIYYQDRINKLKRRTRTKEGSDL